MAHDHGEKIHTCDECNYWHVTSRFGRTNCKGCGKELVSYSSREWWIKQDSKWEGIPKGQGINFGTDGFLDK